jgi:Carboxypeptidase regulatory-like domain
MVRCKMARTLRFAVLLISTAAAVLTASAQTPLGTLSGTVTDPTGTVLPHATVTVRNRATSEIFTVKTDETGRFYLRDLPVGTYYVRADANGLGSTIFEDAVVGVGQAVVLSLKMSRGQAAARPGGATGDGHTLPRDPNVVATGRDFLMKGKSEEAGFGLYSYILFADPPNDESKPRYLAVIKACRQEIRDIAGLENNGVPKNKLNVAYIPVRNKAPNPEIDENWVLDNYDYDRAVVLLSYLPKKYQKHQGPYLVSHATPLSADAGGDFLYQDLSIVNERLATDWIQHFLDRASQEHFWETNRVEDFAYAMREFVADAAPNIDDIKIAVASWIQTISK